MHLASSTSVPTVALFCASDPVLYGPLKPVDLAINVAESTPILVALRCQRMWRASLVADVPASVPVPTPVSASPTLSVSAHAVSL